MQVRQANGTIFGENQLVIDPSSTRVNGETVVVTHAHSDHARLKKKPDFDYLMTRETHSLIKCRSKGSEKVKEIPLDKRIELNDFSFALRNSGHILGSGQVEIEASKRIVFTSDFKLQDSLVQKGAEVLPSDVLVIESTFGRPEYKFPEREKVYSRIGDWIAKNTERNRFSVLCGYVVGKAQELTKIVNEYSAETPLVNGQVFKANTACEENGANLGKFVELNHNLKDFNVLIMPPHLVDLYLLQSIELSIGRKVEAATATGWPGRGFYTSFVLSDHADFNGLMEYVKNSDPKLVLTNHGFDDYFARAVKRNLGIEAMPLRRKTQKTIGEFTS